MIAAADLGGALAAGIELAAARSRDAIAAGDARAERDAAPSAGIAGDGPSAAQGGGMIAAAKLRGAPPAGTKLAGAHPRGAIAAGEVRAGIAGPGASAAREAA